MKFLACAVLASTFTVSAAFAKTISCVGTNAEGGKVSISLTSDASNNVSVEFKDNSYENSWVSDQATQVSSKDGLTVIEASSGSRAEYYLKLSLKAQADGTSAGSLSYDENDSGWEYSSEVSNISCK